MKTVAAGFASRYFWLFGFLGIGCLAAGWTNGGLSWIFYGWAAFACFSISAAYGFFGPKLLGKQPDGTLSPLSLILLLPYFALTRFLRWLKTLVYRSPHSHEIVPRLWLGAWPETEKRLPENCELVVDLTAEFPVAKRVKGNAGRVLCLPALDTEAPTPEQLQQAVTALRDAKGRPVYVHCAAGVGRSATVVGAFLLDQGIVQTIDEAEAYLRQIRPGVRFTPPQRRLLQQEMSHQRS
ncbi:MAG: dual specificity protein phosphatase family protein [Armatimonas sp.]